MIISVAVGIINIILIVNYYYEEEHNSISRDIGYNLADSC